MKVQFDIIPYKSQLWKEAVKLREATLRIPLGSYFSEEELAEEAEHIQVVALRGNIVIGTAVLVPEGSRIKMQRVVVSEDLRSKGIGADMMLFCENYARENSYESIYCHARDSAINFYRQNAYKAE